MQKLIVSMFLLVVAAAVSVSPSVSAAESAENEAIVIAAKAYLREHDYVKAPKVKIEAVEKDFARVLVTPAEVDADPAIMFLQKKSGKWQGLTIGTGFAPEDLDDLKVPERLRPQ